MKRLQPPDTHHLSAALGWLELGNPVEAEAELGRLSPQGRDHPDALEVRWQVCAGLNRWDAALAVAARLLKKAPDRPSGWLHRAYAIRRASGGGLQQAWEALRPAFDKFPKLPVVPYNLACYAAQLGRLDEAWDWLQKAVQAAGAKDSIKSMALADPDLEPLWDRVRQL